MAHFIMMLRLNMLPEALPSYVMHHTPLWACLFVHFKPSPSSAVINTSNRLLHSCEMTLLLAPGTDYDHVTLQSTNPTAYSPWTFSPH